MLIYKRYKMPASETKHLQEWLGITEQQYNILMAINKLEAEGTEPTPKNIWLENAKTFKKKIKTPNLFGILRTLSEEGLVSKERKGFYRTDMEGIKNTLSLREKELQEEADTFRNVTSNIGLYFREAAKTLAKPYVGYIEGRGELYALIQKQLEKARRYYCVTPFPGISFTPEISHGGARRGPFFDTLCERGLVKEDLGITYLTPLDPTYPFKYALKTFGDPARAFREAEAIVDNLERQVAEYDNLDVRHMENPFGFDVVMCETDEPTDFYIFVRNPDNTVIGGIYINSPETAQHAKQQFLSACSNAKRIRGEEGARILKKIRQEFSRLRKKQN